jgi:hypothetical protein
LFLQNIRCLLSTTRHFISVGRNLHTHQNFKYC